MHDAKNVPQSLDGLLFPISQQEFFRLYWGKAFMHLDGTPEKLGGLFPWHHLNVVLTHYRLNPPRVRLVKEGVPVKPATYLQTIDGGPLSVKAAEFTKQLADGATLIIDGAEELYAPLRELVISLERTFRIPIQANLYAGWRTSQGFNLHWDSHDVLVLQVAGRKLWKVYEPTRDFPLRDDYENAPRPQKLVWEGILSEGEIIYMPRGWWHVACPLDGPCLHLTLGLRNQTGMDLLRWFVESLETAKDLRRDLPHWSSPEEKSAHSEKLKQHVIEAWTSDMIDSFLAEKDAKALPRLHFSLPEAASAAGTSLLEDSLIRLVAPRPLEFSHDPGQGIVRFRSCGREWRCTDLLLPLLKMLNKDGNAHPVPQFLAAVSEQTAAIRQSLQELISQGFLVVESGCREPSQQIPSLKTPTVSTNLGINYPISPPSLNADFRGDKIVD
jgi:hypothetical protein